MRPMFYGGGSSATHTVNRPSTHAAPRTPQSHPQPSHSTAATARQSINFRREEESSHSSSSKSSNHSAPKTSYSHPSQAATQRFHATDGSSQTRPAAPQHHDTVHISETARNLSAEANSSQEKRASFAFRHEEEAARSGSASHSAAETTHPATTVSTVASHRFQPTIGGGSAVTNEHHDTVQISERARQLSAQTQSAVNQRARVQFFHEEQLSKDSESQHQNAKPMSAAERRVNVGFRREEEQSTSSDTQQSTKPLTPAERRANIEFEREEDSSKAFAPRSMEEQIKEKNAYAEWYYHTQVAPHSSWDKNANKVGEALIDTSRYIVHGLKDGYDHAKGMLEGSFNPALSQQAQLEKEYGPLTVNNPNVIWAGHGLMYKNAHYHLGNPFEGAIQGALHPQQADQQFHENLDTTLQGVNPWEAGTVRVAMGTATDPMTIIPGIGVLGKVGKVGKLTKDALEGSRPLSGGLDALKGAVAKGKNHLNQFKDSMTNLAAGPDFALPGGGSIPRTAFNDGGDTISYIRGGSRGSIGNDAAKGTGNALSSKTPAERAAEKGFPNIKTTKNGGPDFEGTQYLYPVKDGQKNIVSIKLTGDRKADFKAANEAAGFQDAGRNSPDKRYTWHHVDDYDPSTGTATMQLVDRKAHEATLPHKGSASQYEKYHNVRTYNPTK